MRFETVSGKARIAANSRTIGKIRNAAGGRFGLIDAVHELIRGSLIVPRRVIDYRYTRAQAHETVAKGFVLPKYCPGLWLIDIQLIFRCGPLR